MPSSRSEEALCDKIVEQLKPFVKELFKTQFKQFNSDMEEYKKSVDYCSSKMDNVLESFKSLSDGFKEQRKEVIQLTKDKVRLEREVEALKVTVEEQAQYSRNRNLVIDGLPMFHNENLLVDLVPTLSKCLGVKIEGKVDIQAVHRLPVTRHRNDDATPIVIQFTNRQLRDEVLTVGRRKRLVTSDLYPKLETRNLYINEHMTPYYKKLWYETNKMKKDKKIAFAWFRNNKLFVKKEESSKPIIIRQIDDLSQFE